MKCDTEGAEFDIFESLRNSHTLDNIDMVMMEYHEKSPKPLEDILTEHNFIVFYKGFNMLYAVKNRKGQTEQ